MFKGKIRHRYKASNQVNDYEWIEPGEKCNPPAHLVTHLLNIGVIERVDVTDTVEVIKKAGGWVDVIKDGVEIDSGRGKEDYKRLKAKYGR